jgi:Protein of unknown function (DUF2924)
MAGSVKWKSGVTGDSHETADEIAELSKLNAKALKERWSALFGDHPVPRIGRGLLIMAIAYRMQEKAFGRIKPSAERILQRVADGQSDQQPFTPAPPLGAGTVLIREWRGVRHRVAVVDQGVVYCDRHYRSLSEVARAITGTRWSGPRFFGLKRRKKESVNG